MLHWLKCQAQSPAGHQSPAEHPRALGPIQGMMGQHLCEPAGALGRGTVHGPDGPGGDGEMGPWEDGEVQPSSL